MSFFLNSYFIYNTFSLDSFTDPYWNNVSLLLRGDGIGATPNGQQNNTFLDSSANNYAITRNGTPTQGSFSPYPLNEVAYSPTLHGGSLYVGSTSDYLRLPYGGSQTWQSYWSQTQYTMECWVYLTAYGTDPAPNLGGIRLIDYSYYPSSLLAAHLGIRSNGTIAFYHVGNVNISAISTSSVSLNTWTHIALVRNGSDMSVFVNGFKNTLSTSNITSVQNIGSNAEAILFNGTDGYKGYISGYRTVLGSALYTSNFNPATTITAPPTNISGTGILMNFTNGGIFDNTKKNVLTTVGDAKVSTSVVKYGTGSMYFDGTGDYLESPISSLWSFPANTTFTFECWINTPQKSDETNCILSIYNTTKNDQFVVRTNAGKLEIYTNNGVSSNSVGTIPVNTWTHIAISGTLPNLKAFINGQEYNITLNSSFTVGGAKCVVGGMLVGDTTKFYYYSGYIDDLRITKGVARYTANFTPPARAFPNTPHLGVFALSVNTANAGSTTSTQFNLALAPSTSYDFNIDWGDNVIESYTSSNTTGYTHTYPVSGTYLISIGERTIGGFPKVYYNGTGDSLKLLNITQFGGNQFGADWTRSFRGCANLQISATDFATAKTQNITNFDYAWYNCTSLASFPLIDTSKGTYFDNTWAICTSLTAFPLIDTSKGTYFGYTWGGCTSLTAFPLIDTSSGTNFTFTWYNCNKLKDFPAINTLSATLLGGCWSNCSSLTSFPVLSTPNVAALFSGNTGGAWESCTSLSLFPLIDTSKVTNFIRTWQNCTSLTVFPLIDTSKGTSFNSTWYNCNKLKGFPLINTLSGTNFTSTWNNCTSLTAFPLIDTSKGTYFTNTWFNCTSLTAFPLIDTSKGTSFYGTWFNCNKLKDFPAISTLNGTDFTSTWQNCISLSASEFPTLNMSKMTNGTNCFNGVKLTTTSYSSLLTSLCATNFNNTVTFHGGNSTFNTPGSAAKVFLTKSIANGGRGWTITDGGYQAGT